uniref:Uncharacterized protein n=1 Tax=Arundo donax TaxID=35708 RepID=A0A0A9DLI1_ARUDO
MVFPFGNPQALTQTARDYLTVDILQWSSR